MPHSRDALLLAVALAAAGLLQRCYEASGLFGFLIAVTLMEIILQTATSGKGNDDEKG